MESGADVRRGQKNDGIQLNKLLDKIMKFNYYRYRWNLDDPSQTMLYIGKKCVLRICKWLSPKHGMFSQNWMMAEPKPLTLNGG